MLSGSVRGDGRSLRVCVATHELPGLTTANGLGQATANLARALVSAGHHVTVLFAGWASGGAAAAQERYRAEGIDVHLLPEHVGGPAVGSDPVVTAWRVYAWIDEQHRTAPFDVVHCPDAFGLGALCATACRAGTGLAGARVVVGAHGPMSWIREGERFTNTAVEETVQERLERQALRHADAVVSPSRFLLEYYEHRGWELPEARFVRQNCLDPALLHRQAGPTAVSGGGPGEPLHVAFFGRLIRLKGLQVFCDALDGLAATGTARPLTVSFVGHDDYMGGMNATQYIADRARRWPWPVQVHTGLEQAQALAYLVERRALAVIPSLVENSPNTVCEVIAAGIPFVAANTGGISELVHPDDRDRVLFDVSPEQGPQLPPDRSAYAWRPTAAPLTAMLALAAEAVPAPARFAVDPRETTRRHVATYPAIAALPRPTPAASPAGQGVDLVLDGRHLGALAAWQACARQFATATLVLGADQADPGAMPGWRVVRGTPESGALWAALATGAAPTVLVAAGDLHPANGLAEAAGSWLRALGASAAVLPAAVLDPRGGVYAVVPTVGVPAVSLIGPDHVPGATLLDRQAVRRSGSGPVLGPDLVVHDLLNRMTLAGDEVVLVPVIAGARPESDVDRMASASGEPRLAGLTRPELTDMLVAFRRALPPELQDLPGEVVELRTRVGAALQQAAAERAARVRLEAQVAQLNAERDRLVAAAGHGTSMGQVAPMSPVPVPAAVPLIVPLVDGPARA